MLTNEGDYFAVILHFLLPFGLLAIIIAGVWLMIAGSRGQNRRIVWTHFRVHLGTAFLISAITILLVDLQLRREVEASVTRIPNALIDGISQGNPDLARTIREQIVDNDIFYSNMEIHATLALDETDKSPKYVIYKWGMTYTVKNTGPSETDWDFHPNVSSDLEEDPKAVIEHVTVKEGGRDPDLIKDFEKNYKSPSREAPDYVASFNQVIRLKPGIPYQVTISYVIHDRLKGYCDHSLFQITSGIRYTLTLDPDKFDYGIEANYPGGRETEIPAPTSKLHGIQDLDPYVISETLLPYQGFTLYWRPKAKKAGGQVSGE